MLLDKVLIESGYRGSKDTCIMFKIARNHYGVRHTSKCNHTTMEKPAISVEDAHRTLVLNAREAIRLVSLDSNVTTSHSANSLQELVDYIGFWNDELREEGKE